jgi:hypothetical protein
MRFRSSIGFYLTMHLSIWQSLASVSHPCDLPPPAVTCQIVHTSFLADIFLPLLKVIWTRARRCLLLVRWSTRLIRLGTIHRLQKYLVMPLLTPSIVSQSWIHTISSRLHYFLQHSIRSVMFSSHAPFACLMQSFAGIHHSCWLL